MNGVTYVLGVFFICVVYVGAYAVLNVYSRDRVMNDIITAIDERDAAALEGRVQFDALAVSVKERLQGKVSDLSIVDHYAQPDFIEPLFSMKERHFPDYKAKDFVRDFAFDGPFRFSVMMGYPKKEGSGGITTLNESISQVLVFFRLEGWTWKIYKADMPDFLVPKYKFTLEQVIARYGVLPASAAE